MLATNTLCIKVLATFQYIYSTQLLKSCFSALHIRYHTFLLVLLGLVYMHCCTKVTSLQLHITRTSTALSLNYILYIHYCTAPQKLALYLDTMLIQIVCTSYSMPVLYTPTLLCNNYTL